MKRTTLIAFLCFCFVSIFAQGSAPPTKFSDENGVVKVETVLNSIPVQHVIVDLNTPLLSHVVINADAGVIYVYYLPTVEAIKPKQYDYTFIDPCRSFNYGFFNITKITASEKNIKTYHLGSGCGGAGLLCGTTNRLI